VLRVAYAAAGGKYASDAELGAAIAATCIGAPPVFYQGCETLLELKKPIAQLLGFSSFVTGLRFPALCRSGIKGIRIWFVTRICRYRASLICFRERRLRWEHLGVADETLKTRKAVGLKRIEGSPTRLRDPSHSFIWVADISCQVVSLDCA